jgi:hypothetical protein
MMAEAPKTKMRSASICTQCASAKRIGLMRHLNMADEFGAGFLKPLPQNASVLAITLGFRLGSVVEIIATRMRPKRRHRNRTPRSFGHFVHRIRREPRMK